MTYPPAGMPPVSEQPGPIARVPWGWRDLLLGIGVALLSFLAVSSVVIGIAYLAWGEDSVESLVAEALTVVLLDVVLVGAVLLVIRRKGGHWRQLGLRAPRARILTERSTPWTGAVGLIVIAYFVAISSVTVYGVLIDALGLDDLLPGQQLDDEYFDHTSVIAVIGIGVVLGAPLAEEIFFRGFLYAGMRRYMSVPVACLLSGALFASVHGSLGLILPFTIVGAILAYVYERSGTLFAPIGVHFIFNSVSFITLLLVPELR